MRILLTGFEPFGDDTTNPSWDGVCALPDTIGNTEIIKSKLPVVFGKASEIAQKQIDVYQPDAVISVGLAAGRSGISVEFVGINWQDARISDNAGAQPLGQRICDDAPDAYFSTLPVHDIVARIQEAELPAYISYSAGTYVCNDLLFSILHHVHKTHSNINAGFVHVPSVNNTSLDIQESIMTLEDIKRALELCIISVIENKKMPRRSFGTIY